ncbi:cytochrome P450 family protein [Actinacidiphila paucisporea]|uniref:Cytochrome P450 n=1 Tax=Actinacidiphila paucisporea TaxID=310782 RepID=A0A1M7MFF3_9ACTN|nr:cytochrome P450 [Actinacidiphila paucisporea]SHM89105.1 Cytochrome P450 [Actinacidiphila paucisporea]
MTTALDLLALGPDFTRNPYPVYADLRARGPVHRVVVPEGAEAWLVVGYEAGRAALADPRLSKVWGNAAPSLKAMRVSAGLSLLSSDPPVHTRLRRTVAREFTTRRVSAMAPRVREIVADLVGTMAAKPSRRADLVESLAFPLPMTVICELLGVPFLDRAAFRGWSNDVVAATAEHTRMDAAAALKDYLVGLISAKRDRRGEDLLSALIHTADEDGDQLSAEELLGMAWVLLVAGHETTVNLISNGVLALLTHPEQLAALRADPDGLLDGAVEEILRYDGPVETPTYRFTVEPVEIGGTVIPGDGRLVLIAIADADRDPARFPDPDRFDIRRDARGHIAFGHGIHYCVGAPLARLEARIALRGLLDAFPNLALDANPAELQWRGGVMMRGPRQLPVRW